MRTATQLVIVVMFIGSLGTVRAQETRSLAGEWRFSLDAEGPAPLPGNTKIKLPGTMDDAGLGPKNNKPGTLLGPSRLYEYAGPAWYQHDIEIPASWAGKRVTLLLERCRWVTTVWIDDERIGSQDSLVTPHVYDFGTTLNPGKHRLTICVDNTMKLFLGKFVSVFLGGTPGNMNGIVGRIELSATPPVWLSAVQVYPDVDKKQARVAVSIGNATGKAGKGTLSVGDLKREVTWAASGGRVEVEVDMSGAKLWDEYSPNLQKLTVRLGDAERTVTFGMRKFATTGTQFTLNNRPVFLRGTLECSVWPLTGYPPTDVPTWQRIYRIMKSHGLNHIRFHSWTPPEAAFEAADIEGIMIQTEGPMTSVPIGEPKRDAFMEAEFIRIVDTYGNHPSFCLMTSGNELFKTPPGKEEIPNRWVDMLIQRDPRHLYSSASQGAQTQKATNRQFTVLRYGRGVGGPGTKNDVSSVVSTDKRPIVGHEVGQWTVFPDLTEINKYTGVLALKNFEIIRNDLEKRHLLDLAPQFVQASGKLSTLLYKEEIEKMLRTPGYAGFQLLDLHDYPCQGTASVGTLNAFWESKGFTTPEEYSRFCGPTVPLLRIPKRTYTTDEPFEAAVDVAHYGPADMADSHPVWTIKDVQGRQVASGSLPALNIVTGKLTPIGAIKTSLAQATAPCKLTVTVSVGEFSNDWEIWVYPPDAKATPPADVVVCTRWDEAKEALADGKKVVLFPQKTKASLPGYFKPVFWSPFWWPSKGSEGILCDPKHPAFARFPTDFHTNWQWWDMLNNSHTLILDDTPAEFRPIVLVIDNYANNHKLGNLLEVRVGTGKLLVCTMDLPRIAGKSPAANQLLQSLYAYAGSAAFEPTQTLTLPVLDHILAAGAGEYVSRNRSNSLYKK